MMRVRLYGLLLCLSFMTTVFADVNAPLKNTASAEESQLSEPNILSFSAKQTDWVFSGMVNNENGESYHYFFQLKRDNQTFHATAALIDAQTNALVIYEESKAHIEQPENSHWQVGRTFLRFNAINNSWIFGVKNKDKKGFNFKVDMMGQAANASSKQQDLRAGIEFLVNQTGRLNGHLQTGKDSKEQFVTAKNAWFRQMWASKPQDFSHPVTAILCEFNDGGGFYSVNLRESDALKGAVAGWRDGQGMPLPMSQFVTAKAEDKEGLWRIQIPSPKMTLTFNDLLHQIKNNDLVAGIFKGQKSGFCAISLHDIGREDPVKPT